MPDPIQVEEMYQELTREIEDIPSTRYRFHLITTFISELEGQLKKYKSYLTQLAYKVPHYTDPITYSGLDPRQIESDIQIFNQAENKISELTGIDPFQKGLSSLYKACMVQYGFSGDFEKANQYAKRWLGLKSDHNVFEALLKNSEDNAHILLHGLKNLLNREEKLNKRTKKKLKLLIGKIENCLKQHPGSLLIPAVEKYESEKGVQSECGRLRWLQINILEELKEKNSDFLSKNFQVYGVEQTDWQEKEIPLEAARNLLSQNSNKISKRYFKGEARYQLTNAIHEGDSANTAIAALWYTNVQKFSDLRDRFELNSRITITGNINAEGDILPVEDSSIKSKANAAFFSWSSYLIVPYQQLQKFEDAVNRLNRKFPGRKLEIFGIKKLQDVFYDRRLSEHISPRLITYAGQQLWQRKSDALTVFIFLLLLAAVARLIHGPIDNNPVLHTFTGEVLQVKNASGSILETHDVGSFTVRRANSENERVFADFADIDGDGKKEIVWGKIENVSGSNKGYVMMKKVGSQQLAWTTPLEYDLDFPNKPFLVDRNYYPAKLYINDLNSDGEMDLLTSKDHSLYFPGIISIRDPLTGVEKSHFVNTGRIRDFITADITGDGIDEIIFCGINNAYDMAFLGILKYESFDGMSPHTEEYKLNGYSVQPNLSYILLPKSVVGKSISTHQMYNRANRVSLMEEQQLIEVLVQDFTQYSGSEIELPAANSRLMFYINYDLSIRGIGTSDGYDLSARVLMEEGIIDEVPDYRYFEALKDSVLYWNGEEFVKTEEFFN